MRTGDDESDTNMRRNRNINMRPDTNVVWTKECIKFCEVYYVEGDTDT